MIYKRSRFKTWMLKPLLVCLGVWLSACEPQSEVETRFTSAPATVAETGFVYSAQLKTEPRAVQYSLTQGPAQMTLDPDSGLLQWTPAHNSTGTYTITVVATIDGADTNFQSGGSNSPSPNATTSIVYQYELVVIPGNTGDVNEDGQVNGKDLLLTQRFILELDTATDKQKIRADLNADGDLKASDIVPLERTVLGISS